MTDKELLELAAKAAGIGYQRVYKDSVIDGVTYPQWNPLTDDGDAFRLAVELGLAVDIDTVDGEVRILSLQCGTHPNDPIGKDPYAATRRAIVRAAAEIGRSMK